MLIVRRQVEEMQRQPLDRVVTASRCVNVVSRMHLIVGLMSVVGKAEVAENHRRLQDLSVAFSTQPLKSHRELSAEQFLPQPGLWWDTAWLTAR